MYAFHILTRQAANSGQNYKQKKYTFHNFQIFVRQSVIGCKDSASESRTKHAWVMPSAACLRNFDCKIRSRVSQKSGHPTKI